MKNPSAKGSQFERDIAKRFSLWVSNGKDPYIYARRQGSGGQVRDKTGGSLKGGDITCEKAVGEWLTNHISFELKFYKDLTGDLWNHFAGKNNKIDSFIDQAESDAKIYNKNWMLIMKCNHREILCVSDSIPLACWYTPFDEILKLDPEKVKKDIEEIKKELDELNKHKKL